MRRLPILPLAFLLAGALVLVGCDSTDPDDGGGDTSGLIRVEDVPADPPTRTSGGRPQGTGRYTLYSLRDSSVVLRYDNTNRSDSASTAWDLAFQSTNILVNGGASGPGSGAAYVAEAAFQEVTEVDTDRLEPDSTGGLAIPSGSGNGWYNYNPSTNVVSPIPGRTVVVRAADGASYAKIRIVSYYEGAPQDPTAGQDESRHYTFEYVLSGDRSFE
jgi:hypothetical protein